MIKKFNYLKNINIQLDIKHLKHYNATTMLNGMTVCQKLLLVKQIIKKGSENYFWLNSHKSVGL